MRFLLLILLLSAFASAAMAGEPSWFVYEDDAIEIHIANKAQGQPLTNWSPAAVRIWVNTNGTGSYDWYTALPIIVKAKTGEVRLVPGDRFCLSTKTGAVCTIDGPWYDKEQVAVPGDPIMTIGIVEFSATDEWRKPNLRHVTGVTAILQARVYDLHQNAELQ